MLTNAGGHARLLGTSIGRPSIYDSSPASALQGAEGALKNPVWTEFNVIYFPYVFQLVYSDFRLFLNPAGNPLCKHCLREKLILESFGLSFPAVHPSCIILLSTPLSLCVCRCVSFSSFLNCRFRFQLSSMKQHYLFRRKSEAHARPRSVCFPSPIFK